MASTDMEPGTERKRRGRPRKSQVPISPPTATPSTGNGAAPPETRAGAEQLDEFKITTAADWKRSASRRWLLSLPTGCVVKARTLDPSMLVLEGHISPEDIGALTTGLSPNDQDQYDRRLRLARIITALAVVEPKVLIDTKGQPVPEDALLAEDIPAMDAFTVMGWSMGFASTAVKAQECD